ncbi:diacylglycerol kinase [Janthinobacterium lividum]|uniref:diacylglycerol kinase n=1 Tax=Janthinobacterium lividum TaxID=29581 RepID=UPI000451C76C|nr:diacylglycerol kinase [Janthinobacterium lividum]EZP41382.1 Undecaprenol kinase [Janthinobacterium lividum]
MKNQSFFKRMGFALQGVSAAFRMESSFRLQCLATMLVLIVLSWCKPALIWWALLLLNCGMVLAAELFNTALEHLSDHLHPSLHPSIKIAKDCAAAAVLLLSITAVCVFVAFLLENVVR